MESEIIQNPFYHYTYVFDKNTGNLEYPDVYLLSKGLHKLGQLYPVNELNIVVKANDADEVSFTFHKYVNDTEQELYNKVKTDSVVYIKGFGCFQLKVNENDKGEGVYKSVSGESLADVELSNILATLEINTEQDILVSDYENENVTDYIPTVFFRDESKYDDYTWSTGNSKLSDNEKKQKLKDSSLLHRIFSYAPHYEIGHVDESLYYVQRDFSWSNSYIKDILNDVAEEVGCIFTFETYLDDNGKTVRKVNAYDISYCEKCYHDAAMQLSYKTFDVSKFRSITNGVCDNCGSSKYVYDYGKDTDIFITTENLTDEISVQPDNEIKNVFKISGGDDNITSAIQALNMGSSKIMMFSEETKNEMSDELRKKFEDYIHDQSSITTSYETLVETQSNVYDLIQYLQSGKMPQLADNARDIQEEVKYLLNSITEDYENNFYVESYDKGEKCYIDHKETVSSSSIKNLFTLYLDKGYSVRVSNGDIGNKTNPNDSYVRWDGIITVYETSNSDNYADIHCSKLDSTYVVYNQITAQNSDSKLQETYDSFYVNLMFADQDSVKYASYIQQFCEQKLASYKKVEYKNEEEKPWNEYCYERLKSFYDGYQACLEVLSEMDSQQTIQSVKQVISDIYNNYSLIQNEISQQMKILIQQINALYRYLGEYTYDTDKYGKRTYSPDYVSEDYVVDYKNILSYLANPSMTKYFIGTKPIACKKCGSSNVGIAKNDSGKEYNYCLSCGNTDSSLLVTYADIAKQVSEQCDKSESNLLKDITEIRNKFKIENYFGELYSELLPYIKEQEYSNSNYTSDACNTNQDIIAKAKELLQKARKELYKACEQQYSVSADVFSIVAERWKNWDTNTKYHDMYDKFSLGNWMRVRLDKTIKKLRLISITFDFDTVDKMSVEFSDVIQVGNVLSDINSVLQQASSISSTYNYVTDQAKQGSEANVEINKILQNGLDSAYSAVMAGDNQEITMDRHGLLFRKFLDELDDYSKYQMKMINRNIVMTDDGWKSARLAIGLGMLPDGTYGYGIWADNIIGGNITCTNNLKIVGGKSSVIIDGDGIRFGEGVIDSSAINGLDDSLKSFVESIGDLQSQIDGEITSWFEEYNPTITNEPASLWTTDADKIKHEGDLFYNTATGAAYRYIYNSSIKQHEWSVITDTAITEALANAAKAQDTADGKRRVFTTTPTPPYDIGDLWSQGSNGDIMVCVVTKLDGQDYSSSDWAKASKYTDDTAFKNFVEGDYAKTLEDINTQIDGKADTFYQSTKPHEEYTNVSDNNTYNLYVGDLWYDTTTGKSYMYTKTANGSNYNYTWKFMDVPNDVYDTIDGIASIYVTLPSNPNVGDLLIPNTDIDGTNYKTGKVYKYNGSSWVEIKYTDDTAWETWTSDTGDFGKYKKDIQTQLDGKSNCTYGGSTPPSNPETGDLWFCTDSSSGYGANKAYMYNGSSWVESNGVPDSVWDIADGKSSIFVIKPDTPLSDVDSHCYYKGDIWILESDMTLNGKSYKKGSIMTSTSDSTSFVETHWIEKVRYTDDTKANSVDDALIAYKKEISEFQTNVSNCLGTTKITKDAVISPKIGGGYAYFTSGNYSVEIDPSHSAGNNTLNGYLFAIRDKSKSSNDQVIMGVDTSGNGYFNGDIVTNNIVANNGNIGSWEFDGYNIYNGNGYGYIYSIDFGKPEKPVGGYTIEGQEYYPCQRIMSGKTVYGLYYKKNSLSDNSLENFNHNNFTQNYQYADVSCDGFYCSNGTLGSNYLFAAKTREGIVEMNGEVKMNGKVKVFNGLCIQATSSDYVELSTTAYDSSAANAYLVNSGSMKIGYRLQVGDATLGYDPNHTFRVVGSSYVTGTSYTNSGTTVTSDKNKKNSICTPSDYYVQLFDEIIFKLFKYNDGTSDRYHLGIIAQELEEAMRSVGISNQDFGGLVIDEQGNYFVRYDEINILTALKVKQLEESRKEVEEQLEKRISILEERISVLEKQIQK